MADSFILKDNANEKKRQYSYGLIKEYNDFGNIEWTEIRQRDINSFVVSENTTIECCFKISAIESGTQGRIFEMQNISGSLKYCINYYNGILEISFNGSSWNSISEYILDIDKLYTISTVIHDSITDVYINGVYVKTLSGRIAAETAIYKIMMKTSWATNNRRLQGRIYSLRLYNRALSEIEILYNYKIDNYGGENIEKAYSIISNNLFNLQNFKNILSSISNPIANGNIEWLENGFKLISTNADCYTSHETNSYWIDVKPNTIYELTMSSIGSSRILIFLTSPVGNPPIGYEYYNENKIIFTTLGITSKILIRFGIWESGQTTIFQNIQLREKNINEEKLKLDLTYKNYVDGIVREYNDGGNNLDTIITSNINSCFNISQNTTIEVSFSISAPLNSDQEGYARLFEIADSGNQIFLGIGFMDDFTKISLLTPSGWKEYIQYNFDFNKKYTCTIIQNDSEIKVYINGQLLFQVNETIKIGRALYKICLKGSINVAKRFFNGRIYSFRLYDKALTNEEILHNCYIDEQEGVNEMCMEITEYERYLKSIMQVGITQDANNLGHYTQYSYRNAIPVPQIYPRDIVITADNGFELTYQFYKTNRTGINNQLVNGQWASSFEIPANTYFCFIIRHANDSGKTKTLPDDSCNFTVTLKD